MDLLKCVLFLSSCIGGVPPLPIWSDAVSLDPAREPARLFLAPGGHELVALIKVEGAQRLEPLRVPLYNGIQPSVRVAVSGGPKGFHYAFAVENGTDAHDPIWTFDVVGPRDLPGTEVTYDGPGGRNRYWVGLAFPGLTARQTELDARVVGRHIFWNGRFGGRGPEAPLTTIPPGETRAGFGINSPLSPGFTTARFGGLLFTPFQQMVDDPVVWAQYDKIPEGYTDVTTITFGPMFLPTGSRADVLANYLLGVRRLRDCRGLPHTAAFLDEVEKFLTEPHVESRFSEALGQITTKPGTPIEEELMNCLKIVAQSLKDQDEKKKAK